MWRLRDALSAFEKYMHGNDALPALACAGLLHVQFETIHTYLDGDGRIGRLLIALLLERWSLLKKPLLYVSVFFKRHRAGDRSFMYQAYLEVLRVGTELEPAHGAARGRSPMPIQ